METFKSKETIQKECKFIYEMMKHGIMWTLRIRHDPVVQQLTLLGCLSLDEKFVKERKEFFKLVRDVSFGNYPKQKVNYIKDLLEYIKESFQELDFQTADPVLEAGIYFELYQEKCRAKLRDRMKKKSNFWDCHHAWNKKKKD